MSAVIIELIFCNTCHKRVRPEEPHVRWEKSLYCEPCFEDYLEMVSPEELFEE